MSAMKPGSYLQSTFASRSRSLVPVFRFQSLTIALEVARHEPRAVRVERDVVDVRRVPFERADAAAVGGIPELHGVVVAATRDRLPSGLTATARTQPSWASTVRSGFGSAASPCHQISLPW